MAGRFDEYGSLCGSEENGRRDDPGLLEALGALDELRMLLDCVTEAMLSGRQSVNPQDYTLPQDRFDADVAAELAVYEEAEKDLVAGLCPVAPSETDKEDHPLLAQAEHNISNRSDYLRARTGTGSV